MIDSARRRDTSSRLHPWEAMVAAVVLGGSGAAVVSAMAAPASSTLPATIAAIPVVLGCLLVCRHARPSLRTPISPVNVAQVLFAIQLVVIPLMGLWSGYSQGPLWRLPSPRSISIGLLVQLVGYAAFCVSYQRRHKHRLTREREGAPPAAPESSRDALRRRLALAYLPIGLIGAYFVFGGLGGYLRYFSSPESRVGAAPAVDATLVSAAGTFLRPFLSAAIILFWSVYVRRAQRRLVAPSTIGVTVVAALLLVLSNASYNRGSMVAPLIALMGAYSLHIRRLRPAFLGLVAICGTIAVVVWGEYRTSANLQFADLLQTESAREIYGESNTTEQLQIYGQGSQFLGFFLEETGFGTELRYGRTIPASLFYPVPVLGKSFRADSVVTLYNRLIYGNDTSVDQIVPFAGELFLNFHLLGVAVGFAVLGALVEALQTKFLQSPNPFEAYMWCLIGTWTAFLVVGNLAVTSQIYVYFFWPFYLYGLAALVSRPGSLQTPQRVTVHATS